MSERSLRIRLGLFVVLALVLLVTLVILFGSFPSWFDTAKTYTVRFTDAPGTTTGTPVRRSGIRIGQVENIRLEDETGEVLVTIAIDDQYSIRKHEVPTLVLRPLGGDATIDFIPPDEKDPKEPIDRSPVPPGTELKGKLQTTVVSLLDQASEVVPTTQETINEIRKSIKRLEELAPVVDETLREARDLAKGVREAVPDARRAINEYRGLARDVRDGLPEVQKTNKEIQDLVKSVKDVVPEIQKTNQEIQGFAKAAKESIPDLRRTSNQVRELAKVVQDGVPDVLETNKEIRELTKAIREGVPKILETNDEIKGLAKTIKDGVPKVLETNEEIKDLVKAAKEVVPELKKTNDEARTLIEEVRKAVPTAKQTLQDIGTTARNWGRLGERLDVLVEANQGKIVNAIEKFGDVLQRVGNILSDDNQRNIAVAIRNIRDGSESIPKIMKNIDTTSEKLPELADNANELLKNGNASLSDLKSAFEKAKSFMTAIERVTAPLSERGPDITKNLDEGLANLNATLKDVRAMVRVIGEADGTLNRFLRDPALYNRLDQTIGLVTTKLLPRVDRILKDFEVLADKLARHPEKLGIRGAIDPSNGLKKPPSNPRGVIVQPQGTVIPPSLPYP